MKADVVVIGGGTGGLIAALKMAQDGLDVLVVERSPEEEFGNTWCNDLDLHPFDEYGLPKPLPEELAFPVHRNIRVNATGDVANVVIPNVPNYPLKMSLYQKRLASLCKEAGARILYDAKAIDFLTENQNVVGIQLQEQSKKPGNVQAKVVVVACGAFAPILDRVPDFCDFDFYCRRDDSVSAIQELWKIKVDAAREQVMAGTLIPNEMVFYVGVPGSGSFSTFMYQLDLEQGVIALLAGCKPQNQGVRSPRVLIDEFKDNRLGFCTKRVYGGGRSIPMRQSLDNLVDNGIAVLGDAAFMASPANGSGTTPSMVAGALCARTISKVLKAGQEPTKEALWDYNVDYQTGLGATFAGYYIAHRILTTFTEQEVQGLIRHQLIDPENFKNVHDAKPIAVEPIQGMGLFMRALPVLHTLIGFVKHGAKAPIVTRHYRNYPTSYDPETFTLWRQRANKIFKRLDVA